MCRVAFGDEYRVASAFGDEGVLAVALALEGSGHLYAVGVQLIFVFVHFCDVVVHRQFGQDVHAQHLQRMCGEMKLFKDVFQGEYFVLFYVEEFQQYFDELFLLHAFAGFLFFLFGHNDNELICKYANVLIGCTVTPNGN